MDQGLGRTSQGLDQGLGRISQGLAPSGGPGAQPPAETVNSNRPRPSLAPQPQNQGLGWISLESRCRTDNWKTRGRNKQLETSRAEQTAGKPEGRTPQNQRLGWISQGLDQGLGRISQGLAPGPGRISRGSKLQCRK